MPSLARRDLLLRHYHKDQTIIGKDYPSRNIFLPDKSDGCISVYDAAIWAEARIRKYFDKCTDNNGASWRSSEYGLLAIGKPHLKHTLKGYKVKPDPIKASTKRDPKVPANPAHALISPPKKDRDAVSVDLYSLALGYSCPPVLRDEGLIRCARWVPLDTSKFVDITNFPVRK